MRCTRRYEVEIVLLKNVTFSENVRLNVTFVGIYIFLDNLSFFRKG